MRVLVLVKASPGSEAGTLPSTEILAAMGKYNQQLVDAGVLVAAEGLLPSSTGKRVKFNGKQRVYRRTSSKMCPRFGERSWESAPPSTTRAAVATPLWMFASYGDSKVSVCNPLPISALSQCDLEPDHCIGYGGGWVISNNLNNGALPTNTMAVCHFCPGTTMSSCFIGFSSNNNVTPTEGGCTNIGKIKLPYPTAAQAIACLGATPVEYEGKSCGVNADCCSVTGALVCADSLCVPTNE